MQFTELGLKATSLKAIEKLGFVTPSEIQQKSIPLLLEKDIDFIGQAQTGTGKTAAFVLPLLEKIDRSSNDPQALIIAPTRELAYQISEEIKKLSEFEPIQTVCVYGGIPMSGQIRDIKRLRPHVIVGTPGRLIDMIDRGVLKIKACKYVILDEADEMLDMGFFDDVKQILEVVEEKKIWMFSATMPKPILDLVNRFFCDPIRVKVTKDVLTQADVSQQFLVVRGNDQAEALCRLIDFYQDMYAIVFCRTKIGTNELTDAINARGYAADCLHGDMSQDQRDYTMKLFKEKKTKLLICTDVAARGIDVDDLTHVINFSLPQDNESYVHRIGRTGRGGKKGVALSIIVPAEQSRISQIERITKARIERIQLPKIEEIKNVLMTKAVAKMENFFSAEVTSTDFENFKKTLEGKSADDLLKALYKMVAEENVKRYAKANSIDMASRQPLNSRSMAAGGQSGYDRFFLNLGQTSGLTPGDLIKFVSKTLQVSGSEVGKIQIMSQFSFFEMPTAHRENVLTLSNESWNGYRVAVEVAKERAGGSGGGDRYSRGGDRGGFSRGGDRGGYSRGGGRPSGGTSFSREKREGFAPRGEGFQKKRPSYQSV